MWIYVGDFSLLNHSAYNVYHYLHFTEEGAKAPKIKYSVFGYIIKVRVGPSPLAFKVSLKLQFLYNDVSESHHYMVGR